MMRFNDITRGEGLEEQGIYNTNLIYWTAPTPVLYEQIVKRGEGLVSHMGAISVKTGHFTGRAANDKFIVKEPTTSDKIAWGDVNKPFCPERFDMLFKRMQGYLHGRDLFVQDCYAGADREHRLPIRVITEKAWHSLFARNMFVRATPEDFASHSPEYTVLVLPDFHAIPSIDGTNSEAFIIINFARRLILIGGTSFAGEIKKSIFTVLNYTLPVQKNIMTMHCSANVGARGDATIFFGLSGTGKTTLSADPNRSLIGDDEHGWDDKGVFNFEGGCYANIIRLSKDSEPEIYETTRRFATILENVAIDTRVRRVDLDDDSFSENTRASYPITHIPNALRSGTAGHPSTIIMLTCDAYGVLPPIARLNKEQAMFHFLSGYTAKVGGAEAGITEPTATFSTCFGEPFMPLPPVVYGELLREKIARHNVQCWLLNTGWSGGPYGIGSRIKIAYSRALVNAALDGTLAGSTFVTEPFFGLEIPTVCPGIPETVLNPRNTWANAERYDDTAAKLVSMLKDNFKKYVHQVDPAVARVL